MPTVTLYHGSRQIIEVPQLHRGNPHNDYGQGFYCTKQREMAGEWACKSNTHGFINTYTLEQSGLTVLDLTDGSHSVLNWITLLLKNRTFCLSSPLAADAREYLIRHFAADTSQADLIIGYRADDSCFQYAEAFVENTLPLRGLSRALRLGQLGLQTVLISEKAFRQLRFVEASPAEKTAYYPSFLRRDSQARRTYQQVIARDRSYLTDVFVLDIIREEMANDDPRLQ